MHLLVDLGASLETSTTFIALEVTVLDVCRTFSENKGYTEAIEKNIYIVKIL